MNRISTYLSLVLLLSSSIAVAQSPPPPQNGAAQPAAAASNASTNPRLDSPPLKENVTLSVKGTSFADTPVDWTWTGAGPNIQYDSRVKDNAKSIVFVFSGAIIAFGDAYKLFFSLTCNFPVVVQPEHNPDGTTPGRRSTTYNPIGLTTTVILKLGVPLTVVDHDGKTLTLTLTKAATP
jgi:hypothetical protein